MNDSFRARLPEWTRMRAESLGEAGVQWIRDLDTTVAAVASDWHLQLGDVLPGGSESLVVLAQREDGSEAVLKIGLPGSADLGKEAAVYTLAEGRGYAELYAHDVARNVLLLERLGPSLREEGVPVEEQIRHLCRTLQDAWISLDHAHGLMTGAEKARWLQAFIRDKWPVLGRPSSSATYEQALAYADERAQVFTPTASVLVHGDAHSDNTLRAGTADAYKFVDPDGLFAEKTCDLATLMRDWSAELLAGDTMQLARERCALLATLTGANEEAIWQWGFIERVSTGLVQLEIGLRDEGTASLAVADQIAGSE